MNQETTNRRTWLLTGVTAAVGVAGCLGSPIETVASPNIAVSDVAQPEPIVGELNRSGTEYAATVENTGLGGDILAELYFADREGANAVLEDSQQLQLDADEHSVVTFVADRPDWAEGFLIEAYGTRYVANIQNTGSTAVVNAKLVDVAEETVVEEAELTIPAETTEQIEFTTTHRFDGEYEIRTSLIDW